MRFFLFLVLVVLPLPVFAMQFSEIGYDLAGSDENREWIELENDGAQPVDLTGFYFYDGSYHTLAIPPAKGGQGDIVVPSGQRVVLADDAATFLAEHANFSGPVIDTVMSLPNFSASRVEPIKLQLTDQTKTPVAEVGYLPTKDGVSGFSLELKEDGSWHDSELVGGTPGAENSLIAVVEHVAGIHLSEILANPVGDDSDREWFELENTTDQPVNLSRWYITDKPTSSGRVNRFIIPEQTVIEPKNFLLLPIDGSLINNSDETISLYWPDDALIETVELAGAAKDDWSFAKVDGLWQWTDRTTPNASNLAPLPTIESSESPAAATSPLSAAAISQKALGEIKKISRPAEGQKTLGSSPKPTKVAQKAEKSNESPKRTTSKKSRPKTKKLTADDQTIARSSLPKSSGLPTGLAQVAGVSTQGSSSPSTLRLMAYILLPIVSLALAVAIAIYRFKLLLIIPRLKELWPSDLIK